MEFLRQNKAAVLVVSTVLLLLGGLIVAFAVSLSNVVTVTSSQEVPPPVEGAPSSTTPGMEIVDPDLPVLPKENPADLDLPLQPKNPADDVARIDMCVHHDDAYAGSPECIPPALAPSTPAESTPPMQVTIDMDISDADILRTLTGKYYVWSGADPEVIAVEVTTEGHLAIIRKAGFDDINIVDVRLSHRTAESIGFSSSNPSSEFILVVGK